MIITTIEVEYRELRSKGYPSFNNITHGVSLRAELAVGENESDALARLQQRASEEVRIAHGDVVEVKPKDNSVLELCSYVLRLHKTLEGGSVLNSEAKACLTLADEIATKLSGDNVPF